MKGKVMFWAMTLFLTSLSAEEIPVVCDESEACDLATQPQEDRVSLLQHKKPLSTGRVAGPASLVAATESTERAARVLYAVYSGEQNYHTRVKWIMQTWGSLVPKSQLLIVGDQPATLEGDVHVMPSTCAAHNHRAGMCCKYAQAVIYAHEALAKDNTMDWAFFTDDDAYLAPKAMSLALGNFTLSGHGTVAGKLGCSAGPSCAGICGGGGYAADRKAIAAVVGANASDFMRKTMETCASRCRNWPDVAMTQVFKDEGVDFVTLAGVHPWKMKQSDFDKSLTSGPLLYHYVNKAEQFEFLHSLFTGNPANKSTFIG